MIETFIIICALWIIVSTAILILMQEKVKTLVSLISEVSTALDLIAEKLTDVVKPDDIDTLLSAATSLRDKANSLI